MIWYVPIEPLPERYTESWYKNIPTFFENRGAKVYMVTGPEVSRTVEVGTFLDINSTVYYKSFQMAHIANKFAEKKVKDGDVFWFADAEFWGLEAVRLLAQMNKVQVFIFAFLHAASYTKEDAFAVATPYQQYTELGWLAACDKVFVGSAYHKNALYDRRIRPVLNDSVDRPELLGKVEVTGNPLFKEDYESFPAVQKSHRLIICNRFDWEKRPNLSLDFAYLLKKRNPILEIIVTTSRPRLRSNQEWLVKYARALEVDGVIEIKEGLSKPEYHLQLAASKVMLSNTIEENFGYCVIEACIYGCCPIVQDAFSHTELLQRDQDLLFQSEDEIIPKVERILYGTVNPTVQQYASRYFMSMDRIWDVMQVTVQKERYDLRQK